MTKPILLAVDDDPQDFDRLRRELQKRYGVDYDVICRQSPQEALHELESLRDAGGQVAVILADQWMPEMPGTDFLKQAHDLHPYAKRGLLIHLWDSSTVKPIVQAMTMGWADLYLAKPVSEPDERFHRTITELLDDWSQFHRTGPAAVQIVGEQWSARSHEFRDLLNRYGMSYHFHDIESQEGRALLQQVGRPDGPFPVVVMFNGQVMVDPSNLEVAEALGAVGRTEGGTYDVIIIGAGPAGLSAAVYSASEGLRTLVIEREATGGQAGTSSRIRNYLGFPLGIRGGELANRAYNQAFLFGTEFYLLHQATGLQKRGQERVVTLANGTELASQTVVLAMGAAYQRLGIPRLEALVGAGVFYGGAVTEAPAMKGQPVFVAGAGNSAGQAAIYLAKYAERVTILVRGESLEASMSDYLVKEIRATANIDVRLHTKIVDGHGARHLEQLMLQDSDTGKTETVPAAALFVLIGARPRTEWLPDSILRDASGFIRTGKDLVQAGKLPDVWPLERAPLLLETSIPGVFAAGDVRSRSVKRVASSVGEGGIAVQLIHEYMSKDLYAR